MRKKRMSYLRLVAEKVSKNGLKMLCTFYISRIEMKIMKMEFVKFHSRSKSKHQKDYRHFRSSDTYG